MGRVCIVCFMFLNAEILVFFVLIVNKCKKILKICLNCKKNAHNTHVKLYNLLIIY